MTLNSDPMSLPLRRSVLCLPASNARAIAKLSSLDMDAIILDLEDAVAEEQKDEARKNIRDFLAARPIKGREIVVRINAASTAHYEADLALVVECEPHAVLIPKVNTADDILDLSGYLSDNDAPETMRIWAMMETPLGILNAGSIAETGRTRGGRLDCLVVGLNDLRKDTGVLPDPARTHLVPWLMQVVLAGRAFGLSVIDSVSNDFRDLAPYEAECAQGRAMGFDGKMLIHPTQVDAANRLFQPSAADVAEAEAIIKAFSDPAAKSLNAISVDGKMVERLHYNQALALAARADKIKSRTPA
jgi:citrate lyase subunit beta/citryl-CoA lyase